MCQYVVMAKSPEPCCPQLATEAHDTTAITDLASAFKALGDPVRLQILAIICNTPDGVCVCDLTGHFDLKQPTISHHLKVLHTAGLLERDKRGAWAYYSPNRTKLAELSNLLAL